MAKLIKSAFSDEYSDDIMEQAKALRRHGIDYIELRHAEGKNVAEMSASDVAPIYGVLREFGIRVSSIGSPLGKIPLDGDMFDHFETARRICGIANDLGAEYVRVFSFYLPDGMSADICRTRVEDALGELIRIAKSHGVKLCHENEAGIYGESPGKCLDLLKTFGGDLGCVFDGGNFVLDGFDAMQAYELLKEHVTYFHVKDALAAGAVVPPGKGEARIAEILSDYAASDRADTFVTLEPHLQTFEGLNALAGKSFDNPYKYESAQSAFDDAAEKLKEIMGSVKW